MGLNLAAGHILSRNGVSGKVAAVQTKGKKKTKT